MDRKSTLEFELLFDQNWESETTSDDNCVHGANEKCADDREKEKLDHHEEKATFNIDQDAPDSISKEFNPFVRASGNNAEVITSQPQNVSTLEPEPTPSPIKPVSCSWGAVLSVLTCSCLCCCRDSEDTTHVSSSTCLGDAIFGCLEGIYECFDGCCHCFVGCLEHCCRNVGNCCLPCYGACYNWSN